MGGRHHLSTRRGRAKPNRTAIALALAAAVACVPDPVPDPGGGATTTAAPTTSTSTTTTTGLPTPGVEGLYSLTAASSGQVRIVRSGSGTAAEYTVSVSSPFRLVGATCALPVGTVVATFGGTGPSFDTTNNAFDATTCAVTSGTAVTTRTVLNADGTISLGLNVRTGTFLLTRVGNTSTVTSPVAAGDYAVVVSGSVGAVRVTRVGTGSSAQYTVSVTSAFALSGSGCSLPAGTVVATFGGAEPSFDATNNTFDGACVVAGNTAITTRTWLNGDNSLTLGLGARSGRYLLTRTGAGVAVPSPVAAGDYSIDVSGSVGAVRVTQAGSGSAAQYTVTVTSPFRLTGAACTLPAGAVVATFTGAGPIFNTVTNTVYNSVTCGVNGTTAIVVATWLNDDNSLTISLNARTGLYLARSV